MTIVVTWRGRVRFGTLPWFLGQVSFSYSVTRVRLSTEYINLNMSRLMLIISWIEAESNGLY